MSVTTDLWDALNDRLDAELAEGTRLTRIKQSTVIRGFNKKMIDCIGSVPVIFTHYGGSSTADGTEDWGRNSQPFDFFIVIVDEVDTSTDWISRILALRDAVLNTIEMPYDSSTADLGIENTQLWFDDISDGGVIVTDDGAKCSMQIKLRSQPIQYQFGKR